MAARQKRSDIVRERRNNGAAQRKRKTSKTSRSSSRATRQAPPTVSRGSMARPPQSANRKEARRRYNVALSATPGAEVRLPAVPQVHLGWRLMSALMTAALLWALYTLWTAPEFTVSAAEISGLERISPNEINTILKMTGEPIFKADAAALQTRLEEAFPELNEVTVTVELPNRIIVAGGERQPVLIWEQNGIVSWIDANGVAFLPRGQAEGLIMVSAPEAPEVPANPTHLDQKISPEMVTAIQTLSTFVPADTVLLYDPQRGLGWVDPVEKWQVYFGLYPDNMDQRLLVYQAIVEELKNRGIQPTLISIEHLHAPYYRTD